MTEKETVRTDEHGDRFYFVHNGEVSSTNEPTEEQLAETDEE